MSEPPTTNARRRILLQRTHRWMLPLYLAAASSLSMWVAFQWFADASHVIWVWPVTAVQLGILLPFWSDVRLRLWSIGCGLVANAIAARLLGTPLWFSLAISLTSAFDVTVAGAILSRGVSGFEDLKSRASFKLFATAAFVAPVVSGLLATLPVSSLLHGPFGRVLVTSILSDAIGIAVLVPVILFCLTGKYRDPRKLAPHLPPGVLPAILFTAVVVGVFSQSIYPLLFLIFPPLVLLIMVMGLEGAIFANVALVLIACYATAHGHGPLWLSRDVQWEERLVILQIFLWVAMVTGLPIGALLDEQRRAEIKANDARSIYMTLLENTADMIILSSFDGEQRFITAASEALTGWTPEEFAKLDRLSTFHPEDLPVADMVISSMKEGKREHQFRYRLRQKSGGWRWVEASARAYFDDFTGEVRGYVGTIRDISSVVKTEEAREQLSLAQEGLELMARTDALTSLPNRRAFDNALDQYILGYRSEVQGVLLILDIDFFKSFNDEYGHQAGDECLRKVGQAISSSLIRSTDTAARWGGEEFCVLMPGAPVHVSERVALNVLDAVRGLRIPHAGNPEGIVTLSIGIAQRTEANEDPSLWVQRADAALYASKRSGKNRFTVAT
ncbi:sensor domain-containing diguanylate cyclase [Terriglobus roseus]|uniref:diguanylate cyclase n=1 Tax=Terriglobus roseus TaxID=392734 RepID=A0A1H4K315_9BACT|nr:diguanylate cyclase [Terriglobus roseus]SEB52949.1 PAS domain S-box-containing protein/diguanylate cyclase (GGDEF) domain-containing protein [Terriglobus roseus]